MDKLCFLSALKDQKFGFILQFPITLFMLEIFMDPISLSSLLQKQEAVFPNQDLL